MRLIINYGVFGIISVLFDLVVFNIGFLIFKSIILANILGYSSGTILSYVLNSRYTFNQEKLSKYKFISFLTVSMIGLTISTLIITFLTSTNMFSTNIAKISSLPLVFLIQFSLNKYFTFKEKTL